MITSSPDSQPDDGRAASPRHDLFEAAATGSLIDFRSGDAKADDPAAGTSWDADRQVTAEQLIGLLTKTLPDGTSPRAVRLRGARITGSLDLWAATFTCPLLLWDCHIDEKVIFDEATAPAIHLTGCHLPALTAMHLQTTGDLTLAETTFAAADELCLVRANIGGHLNLSGSTLANPGRVALNGYNLTVQVDMACADAFAATGKILLDGAHIGAQLHMGGATLINPGGVALSARLLSVDKDMFCADGFTATGATQMSGARIGGALDLNGASLTNPSGKALSADLLTVGGNVTCRAGFTAMGEVNLGNAHIGGQLIMNEAKLTNPEGIALDVGGLTVDRDMSCSGVTATGTVHLIGAHIGGQLIMDRASLASPNRVALAADYLVVSSGTHCADGFAVTGMTSLANAHIGGQLIMNGAKLTNSEGTALGASGLIVDSDMSCSGFTVIGETCLTDAHIGGQLNLDGASLTKPGGSALYADNLTVDHSMNCKDGFTAQGNVSLSGARISPRLDMTGASLSSPGGDALSLEVANIAILILMPEQPPDGMVDLTRATVGAFYDEPATWPAVLYLDGFSYDSLGNRAVTARARLRWLRRDPGRYSPQVYDQLAGAYRRAGDEQAARKVAIAKQRRRRSAFNPFSWLWYVTVGYGYRTWQALVWLAALVILGARVFSRAYPAHMIALNPHPPTFQPVVYTLDLLLPVVGLGQKSGWQPEGPTLMNWYWALTATGWVLATAVVAGLTGILKRD